MALRITLTSCTFLEKMTVCMRACRRRIAECWKKWTLISVRLKFTGAAGRTKEPRQTAVWPSLETVVFRCIWLQLPWTGPGAEVKVKAVRVLIFCLGLQLLNISNQIEMIAPLNNQIFRYTCAVVPTFFSWKFPTYSNYCASSLLPSAPNISTHTKYFSSLLFIYPKLFQKILLSVIKGSIHLRSGLTQTFTASVFIVPTGSSDTQDL